MAYPSVSLKEFVELIESRIVGGRIGISILLTLLLVAGILAALAGIIVSCLYIYDHALVRFYGFITAIFTAKFGVTPTTIEKISAIIRAVNLLLVSVFILFIARILRDVVNNVGRLIAVGGSTIEALNKTNDHVSHLIDVANFHTEKFKKVDSRIDALEERG